jgi:hypothetical protein
MDLLSRRNLDDLLLDDRIWVIYQQYLIKIWPLLALEYVRTQNEQRPEVPARSYRNQTIRFEKPDSPVLSEPTAVRGTAVLRRGAHPPAKQCLDGGEA